MKRLHFQIFLTLVLIVALFGLLVSIAWWFRDDNKPERQIYTALQALIEEALPPSSAPQAKLNETLVRLGKRSGVWITIRHANGHVLGAYGDPLPNLRRTDDTVGWSYGRDMTAGLTLSDGRQVIAQQIGSGNHRHRRGIGFITVILSFVAALAIGAYPLARALTRRLERLQMRVDALGAGDLTARVQVEGRDEVAALASSFNQAADRIQQLVEAQKNALAAASHELRTPLARLRMAFELLEQPSATEQARIELRQRVERDISDLDELIEELLLVSRLDAAPTIKATDDIDLLGLAAEEANRFEAVVTGSQSSLQGDERLIRRLIRNLLENANRHGGGAGVEISIEPNDTGATIRVTDQGPGIPESDRDRIFEPFFRSKSSSHNGGVGLGLFLVRQIARRHGGDARCLPHETGACFEVSLQGRRAANS